MIEVISADRCIRCDICIRICPAFVFDRGEDRLPVIARQDDCQTCFLCEIYCPTDALYVAEGADGPSGIDEAEALLDQRDARMRLHVAGIAGCERAPVRQRIDEAADQHPEIGARGQHFAIVRRECELIVIRGDRLVVPSRAHQRPGECARRR